MQRALEGLSERADFSEVLEEKKVKGRLRFFLPLCISLLLLYLFF